MRNVRGVIVLYGVTAIVALGTGLLLGWLVESLSR